MLIALALFVVSQVCAAGDLGTFERVKAKTFDKQQFLFPDDVRGERLNILFLAMSADQDNGKYQGDVLLEWHARLEERGRFRMM